MTADNFQRSLTAVLIHEGGYVDHPRDPGGATNMGITINTLRTHRREAVSKSDVRNLTKAEAGEIYRLRYWDRVRADELPIGLDYALFDFAVNSGPHRAIKFLQRAIGVHDDGQIGPVTMNAISLHDPIAISGTICDMRLGWLKRLRTWRTFGKGWGRRVNGVKALAEIMAGEPAGSHTVSPEPPPPDIEKTEPQPASAGFLLRFLLWLRRLLIGV